MLATKHLKDDNGLRMGEYFDLLFARARHCLREMKCAQKNEKRNQHARQAIDNLYRYLAELASSSEDHWQREDAVRYIHLARMFGLVTDEQMSEIEANILRRCAIKPTQSMVHALVREVHEYIFLETDPEKIRMMIY